jgi:hypothetical protein
MKILLIILAIGALAYIIKPRQHTAYEDPHGLIAYKDPTTGEFKRLPKDTLMPHKGGYVIGTAAHAKGGYVVDKDAHSTQKQTFHCKDCTETRLCGIGGIPISECK